MKQGCREERRKEEIKEGWKERRNELIIEGKKEGMKKGWKEGREISKSKEGTLERWKG